MTGQAFRNPTGGQIDRARIVVEREAADGCVGLVLDFNLQCAGRAGSVIDFQLFAVKGQWFGEEFAASPGRGDGGEAVEA